MAHLRTQCALEYAQTEVKDQGWESGPDALSVPPVLSYHPDGIQAPCIDLTLKLEHPSEFLVAF